MLPELTARSCELAKSKNDCARLFQHFISTFRLAAVLSDPLLIAGYKASPTDDWYSWQIFGKLAWIIMTHAVDGIITQIRPDDIDENGQYVRQQPKSADKSETLNSTTESMLPPLSNGIESDKGYQPINFFPQ
uniref:Fungal_trans domain-containing protein n=1 Tax=Steinernema glaseri TaxID=37863 RepID=A0A1I7ZI30_9BILA